MTRTTAWRSFTFPSSVLKPCSWLPTSRPRAGTALAKLLAMFAQAAGIFVGVILPVLVIVALGAALQRCLPLHLPTLSKLNIYLLVPALLFVKIYDSTLGWAQIGGIVAAVALPMLLLGLPLYVLLRSVRARPTTVAAVILGGLVINAGNFGLPVAALLYEVQGVRFPGMREAGDGVAVQALVVMMSNVAIWGLGYVILALAKGQGLRGALGYFRLPMIYVVAAAFLLRDTATSVPPWIYGPVEMIGEASIPVMLIVLGAQLAQNPHWPRLNALLPAISVKLLGLPLATALVVVALGLWPWPGAQIIIGMAAPTAVNTLLLTLELDGDAQLAADCVFWSTLLSIFTVTGVILVLLTLAGCA